MRIKILPYVKNPKFLKYFLLRVILTRVHEALFF